MKILTVVQLLSHLFLAANACTEIRVKAKDNSVVVARTMEFMVSLKSDIIVEPKGYSFTATLPENCDRHLTPLTWQHNYTVAYLNGFNMPIGSDGMNSAGLSVGSLLFPGFAKFQVFKETSKHFRSEQQNSRLLLVPIQFNNWQLKACGLSVLCLLNTLC